MARKTPEGRFKEELVKDLKQLFPGCIIYWTDSAQLQGIPDMLVLYGPHWALLEAKASPTADQQPNQDYWVDRFGKMGFSAFIFPENKEDVLHALQQSFESCGEARLPQR